MTKGAGGGQSPASYSTGKPRVAGQSPTLPQRENDSCQSLDEIKDNPFKLWQGDPKLAGALHS